MILAWILWNENGMTVPRLAYRLLPGYCDCGVRWHAEAPPVDYACRKCKRRRRS